jgi:5'-methylthioadenosine phosphorylase
VADTLVGLIGGTGLGEALTEAAGSETAEVDTPFGPPSAPVLMTEIEGQRVAVLARHGEGHRFSPSRVPYRANIFAMKTLGVTHILASTACGSLGETIAPRDLVVADQVIDRTIRPGKTFFDDLAVHVPFADPFCPSLRGLLIECGMEMETTVHTRGTYVCMEGPQFSTRAESHLHRQWGAHLIGMTVMPEAKLAREAEMCYALVGIPTDYDCWKPHEPGESPDAILESILANLETGTEAANALITKAVPRVAEAAVGGCGCASALARAIWTDPAQIPPDVGQRLEPIVGKYLGG